MSSNGRGTLLPYLAPPWLDGKFDVQPKFRVQLANLPTAIHHWGLPGLPTNFSVHVKRDDTTGCTLSGNKVRKLEFILADALDKGCKHVITCGGIQSNHCRTTAVGAAMCGLRPHLFLRTDIQNPDNLGCEGNLLLNRLCGARMYLSPKESPYETSLKPRMKKLANVIEETTGDKAYLIPVGGASTVGVFGYLQAFDELIEQGVLEDFDDLVLTCGSGGTAIGIALGNFLNGSKLKVHCMTVSRNNSFFRAHARLTLCDLGLGHVQIDDIMDVIDGHHGEGYEISAQNELDFIMRVTQRTGIILDHIYTGKAVYGLLQEMSNSPERFQGRRVLFIHTGGTFSLYDGCINDTLMADGATTNQITMWSNLNEDPTSH